jgi:adenylylsulfate kinase-like enzyme
MIEWIYGESGSGKTTLARKLAQTPNTIHLDGDDMRRVWTDLGYSDADRVTQNLRVAHLARVLSRQGFNVAVSTICPTPELRQQVQRITGCVLIHIEGEQDVKTW